MRHARRASIVLVAVTSLLVTLSGAAQAHYVYSKGLLYASGSDCTGGRSEISHGSGGGYSRNDTDALYKWTEPFTGRTYDCLGGWSRPPGYIAADILLFRWSAAQQRWYVCYSSGWHYNTRTVQRFTVAKNFGTVTRCGNGYYGTMTGNYVYNGGWHGGHLWSGYHLLPA